MWSPSRRGACAAKNADGLFAAAFYSALRPCYFRSALVIFHEYAFTGHRVGFSDPVPGLQADQVRLGHFTVLLLIGGLLAFFFTFFCRFLLLGRAFAEISIAFSQGFLRTCRGGRRTAADSSVFRFGAGRAGGGKFNPATGAYAFHDLGMRRQWQSGNSQDCEKSFHIDTCLIWGHGRAADPRETAQKIASLRAAVNGITSQSVYRLRLSAYNPRFAKDASHARGAESPDFRRCAADSGTFFNPAA
jgi:hypothetical protein